MASGEVYGLFSTVLQWPASGMAFKRGLEVIDLSLFCPGLSTKGLGMAKVRLGTCVYLMIRSIWSSFEDLPNTMSTSSGTNTRDFVSFFIFWFCSLPAIWFPVHKIRHLFTVKAYFVPAAGLAFFIWAIVRAKGLGPIVKQPNTIHGSKLGWAMITGIMSSIANFATLIVNVCWVTLSKPFWTSG